MKSTWIFSLGLSFWAAVFVNAAAGQDIAWSPDATEACLAEAADAAARRVCIGRSAAACIETPDGYTTVGMSVCASKEADYWDKRLNAAYKALYAFEKALDAELAEFGSSAPPMSDALQGMQRTWIAHRDATCAYEASQFGGGTGSGPATAGCMMRFTGAQALELEGWLDQKTAQ